ncbi:MAG: phage tail protein [Firmicutes bacterium HGW-Firmicutes-16]|nr:MAG: phage tail protein [Firmicutes bacterium HGW-Firmicutes-16]
MATTYTTKAGDTWDAIAYAVYGSEKYIGHLMQNNFPLLDRFVFEADVNLNTPALPESTQQSAGLPAWRA